MRRSSKKKRDLHSFREIKRDLYRQTKAKTRRAQNDDDEGGEKKN